MTKENGIDENTVVLAELGTNMKVNTAANTGAEYYGRMSCHSCRHCDFNGYVCAEAISPRYGQSVTPKTYCIHWSPMKSVGRVWAK